MATDVDGTTERAQAQLIYGACANKLLTHTHGWVHSEALRIAMRYKQKSTNHAWLPERILSIWPPCFFFFNYFVSFLKIGLKSK